MTDMTFPGGLASLFNRRYTVGKDLAIDPDPDLRGYQEDIDKGGHNDVLENKSGTTPHDITTMPERELKAELDKLAIDEHEATPDEGFDEDRRESVEDLDEDDTRE